MKKMINIYMKISRAKILRSLVSLHNFSKFFLAIINHKDVVAELTALIEETTNDLGLEKRVNHIGKRLKTSQ